MTTRIEDATLHEVAPAVFAYVQPDGGWFINNTGFVVGDEHVLVVDTTATEARTLAFRDTITATSGLPVRGLVNTHWHTDHTNGNYLFPDAAVITHSRARQPMLEHVPTVPDPTGPFPDVVWGDLRPTRPAITVDGHVTWWANSLGVEIRAMPTPAHTTGDLVVWIEQHGVLFAGDLAFNGSTPLVSAGSISGSLDVLSTLIGWQPEVVVPGHGELCGPEVFEVGIAYLEFVLELARAGRKRGLTPLDIARANPGHPFAHLTDGERLVANLHRAFAELDGAAPGQEIDLIATRRDMMVLNGGRPLTCHA
ncbi:MBL fold metallo-hydrolase [Streptomyces sp. NPDC020996]|uniref:MBL fold metallo-hydrolase n=1 Tax=Streptomyces sp. NPDC020996 TaxID=3154791 RepID=UPI0033E2C3CE